MALILNIETGTDICSVALAQDGKTIALRESSSGQDHARKLAVYIDEILKENDLSPDELDAVAVGKGPGSYTGLRIGVSTAKGLCYSLGIPLIAVGSLESLADVARQDIKAGLIEIEDESRLRLCPMIDARRMEIYTQIFDYELNPVTGISAEIVDQDTFSKMLEQDIQLLIFGNGAAKCAQVLNKNGNVVYGPVEPSARGTSGASFVAFKEGRFEDVAYFEPFYLKDFVVTKSKKRLF